MALQYRSDDKLLQVLLECAEGQVPEFEVIGEDPQNEYKFRLKHDCACWNGCGHSTFSSVYALNYLPLEKKTNYRNK